MENFSTYNITSETGVVGRFMYRVYGLMALGLWLTAGAAVTVNAIPGFSEFLVRNQGFVFLLLMIELAVVFGISMIANKVSAWVSGGLFIFYSLLNGVVFSSLVFVYTFSSIAMAFGLTAGMFLVISIYGATTKQDLTRWGQIAMMGLFGAILATFVNMLFVRSGTFDWILNYVVIGIFIVLTAYDTQKLKKFAHQTGGDASLMNKYAVTAALSLYLDFVNLFIRILSLVGNRK